ncbi:MAG: hypothetical protein WBV45_07605 [Lutimonas sp.]
MDEKLKKVNYEGFSLVTGGLIYKLMTTLLKTKDPVKNRRQRALLFAFIAWLPLCLLILFGGGESVMTDELDFFKNFDLHIRFLFAVPFLILIEKVVDRSFVAYIKNSDELIDDKEQLRFDALVEKIDKLSNLYLPEVLILGLIYSVIFIRWNDPTLLDSAEDYLSKDGDISIAGIYYLFVSLPIFQLLLFRWFWRWIIWVYSLVKISKFTLFIDAMNIDGKAGLTYLNLVPSTFSIVFFALAAVLAGTIGFAIINHDVPLETHYFDILFFAVGTPLMLYSPLLIFMPLLHSTKSRAIHRMGTLVAKHNHDYAKKWLDNPPPPKEPVLGSVDNSSLSDINGGYAPAVSMNFIPIDSKMLVTSGLILLVPFLPLAFTKYSFFDLVNIVLKTVFG